MSDIQVKGVPKKFPVPDHFVKKWLEDRQRARTDLMWLAKETLRYRDIEETPHRQLIECLQTFRGGEDKNIRFLGQPNQPLICEYTPACEMWDLQGPRFRLILWPRGHL